MQLHVMRSSGSASLGNSACSGQPGSAHPARARARRVRARQIPVEFKDAQALAHATQLGHVLGHYLDGLCLLLQEFALCMQHIISKHGQPAKWAARTRPVHTEGCVSKSLLPQQDGIR